ncbi:hypothetical protein TIFTF001_007456 [Ficus carica]|uniref:Uncharacterized protein n=1 Tax=Ficus carica TaxID=3494 RepID=A0AA87ZRA2_FICCA|nr:hypothetical protein TIFTF001_007456 [Ficus carica]
MEATEFKDPKMEFFSPPKSGSQSPRFSPPQNGFYSPRFWIQDLEMTAVQSSSVEYTSLKDILPSASASASPAAVAMSPTPSSSWHEIPIRNPLVKHAAMAYLQPMSTPTTSFGDKGGLLGKLKAMCFCHGGEYGCVGWLYDVVWRTVKEVFGELVLDRRRDSEEEDEDEEDEDDDKVD